MCAISGRSSYRGLRSEVVGEEFDANLSVALALLQQAPGCLGDALGEARDVHRVLAKEVVRDHVRVPDLELELGGVGVGEDELEHFAPLRILGVFSDAGFECFVVQFDDNVRVDGADSLNVGEIFATNDTDIKTAHIFLFCV